MFFPQRPETPPKRTKARGSILIPEMFVDPWISEYSRIEDANLRRKLTQHLSSATRETVEARFARFMKEKTAAGHAQEKEAMGEKAR